METNLVFLITKVDGSKIEQLFTVPEDKVEAVIQQLLVQYSQVGVMKKDGSKVTLTPANQIALVECEIPSLVIAAPTDTARVASAADGIRKLTLV